MMSGNSQIVNEDHLKVLLLNHVITDHVLSLANTDRIM